MANIDVYGKNVIPRLYQAALEEQGGPLTLLAARKLTETVRPSDAVMIATGFPERAWIARPVAETDGPPAAATLARSLHLATGALPVIVIDEPFVPMMEATCRGAGMVVLDLEYFENVRREGGFQAVFVVGIPFDRPEAHKLHEELLARLRPSAVIAIERPGQNGRGVHHQVGGQKIPDEAVADMDYLFRQAARDGVLTIGVGDGGNEIGMGILERHLGEIVPVTTQCKCPCGGGSAAATGTDVLVTGTCSNWAVTALEGALALVSGNRHALHTREADRRTLDACSAAGAIDGGVNYNTELAVDDIPWPGYAAVVDLCRDIVDRGLGRP
ncbi:MAG TPA: glutamate cyclase domain-containing protein [Ramlibacter sp.]|uniref:glutamate cyclase domain-containing protein n=1 Tax=Ramlibacter sp. TaxID=1917967 RepID=UPI002BE3AE54|nr:glutamate cyclase domain-containing protein [Ramlibacter sp.]HVZ44250.1 glutamate cyclase domain-containing protein [Ramlibacter sp.]